MISANIDNKTRKAVYARDGYRCALCDSTKTIQIHHLIKRSQGGSNHEHNLITLCSDCHAAAHGTLLQDWMDERTPGIVEEAITEYLADYYAPDWNPWKKGQEPWKGEGTC